MKITDTKNNSLELLKTQSVPTERSKVEAMATNEIVKMGEEAVKVDISEEGKAKYYENKNDLCYGRCKLFAYNPKRFDYFYFENYVNAIADIDPLAYEEFRRLEREEPGERREWIKDYKKRAADVYFDNWIKANQDKIEKWRERGLAGSDLERKYDAELFLSNRDKTDTMFNHMRTLPTRTVMELSVEQYMRIHEQGDKELTELLEASLKTADEIARRLDEAGSDSGETRLFKARIGFTLGNDGTATYYVNAEDENVPLGEFGPSQYYASKDIDELVQNVINKENGMAHFQYID